MRSSWLSPIVYLSLLSHNQLSRFSPKFQTMSYQSRVHRSQIRALRSRMLCMWSGSWVPVLKSCILPRLIWLFIIILIAARYQILIEITLIWWEWSPLWHQEGIVLFVWYCSHNKRNAVFVGIFCACRDFERSVGKRSLLRWQIAEWDFHLSGWEQ